MRALNCKRVARLIALQVAGDLVGARGRAVAAHLASCEECRQLAEEFAESRSLLKQACPAPEFDAEFYSRVRSAVLNKIMRERLVSRQSPFRKRWLYATAFAAVIIVGGLTVQNLRRPAPALADAPIQSEKETAASSSPVLDFPEPPHASNGTFRSRKPVAIASRRSGRSEQMRRQTALSKLPAGTRSPAYLVNAFDVSKIPDETPQTPSGLTPAAQVSRIEIQTSDPNIRIIWLSPREARGSGDMNREQYQHKNDNRK